MYLLDTSVVSELRKPRPHGGVLAWLRRVGDKYPFLSEMTVGEIQAGIELMREQDAAKATAIGVWLGQMAASQSVLAMHATAFRVWARSIHRRSNMTIEDAMIAAPTSVHG